MARLTLNQRSRTLAEMTLGSFMAWLDQYTMYSITKATGKMMRPAAEKASIQTQLSLVSTTTRRVW